MKRYYVILFLIGLFLAIGFVVYLFSGTYHRNGNRQRTTSQPGHYELNEDHLSIPSFSSSSPSDKDQKLRQHLKKKNLTPITSPTAFPEQKVKLGQFLYWDKALSGNYDISCSQCHTPVLGTGDGLSLSIGTGAKGFATNRTLAQNRHFEGRNSPPLFNRAPDEWETAFWDKRVRKTKEGKFRTPAGDSLPETVDSVLASQIHMTITQPLEMRGYPGDTDIFGKKNVLAQFEGDDYDQIWSSLIRRIMDYKEYRRLFREVYPEVPREELEFHHAAEAIATYVEVAFTRKDSPWNLYLLGKNDALSERQKEGAMLFYGKARCSNCHAGKLLTDQKTYNLGVPPVGPGEPPGELDQGYYDVTNNPLDRFAFRTPSLFNVGQTGPWMHNGAYKSLDQAVRHHFHPRQRFRNFDRRQLGRDIQAYHRSPKYKEQLSAFPIQNSAKKLMDTVRTDSGTEKKVFRTLSSKLPTDVTLSEREFDQLMAFLRSLTNPAYVKEDVARSWDPAANLTESSRKERARLTPYVFATIPETVPSGIPIECNENKKWCQN